MRSAPSPSEVPVQTRVDGQPLSVALPRRRWFTLAAWLAGSSLGGVASAAAPASATVVLPLRHAWVDGRQVAYVSTDASDPEVARMLGVNHAPRLRAAVSRPAGAAPGTPTAFERVYAFPGGEQINVFPSAPLPAGPGSVDRSYSPLWIMVEVHWAPGVVPQPLRSEEEVLQAEEQRRVRLRFTEVLVNCPVVQSADGAWLPGVR